MKQLPGVAQSASGTGNPLLDEEGRPREQMQTAEAKAAGDGWLDSWHVNPSLNKEYDCIDGLRGVAILLVVAGHLLYVKANPGPGMRFFQGLLETGGIGVTLFFGLSGFLISLPFWKRKLKGVAQAVPRGYGWRRFWKIYPPLALSVLLFTPMYILWRHDGSFLLDGFKWLVGWPLVRPITGEFNPVMWSLVVEVHFYITLPLVFLCLKRVSFRTSLWVVPLAFLIVPSALRWWNHAHGMDPTIHPMINSHYPSTLDCFVFGIFMAGLESCGFIRRPWAWLGDAGILLLAIGILGNGWFHLHPTRSPWLVGEFQYWVGRLSAGMMLFYIADPGNRRTRLLTSPWLRWCGIISYEWYLFHQPIYFWVRETIGGAGGSLFKYGLIVGGSLSAGLLIAAVVYKYFSLPLLKRGREQHRH